MYAPSSALLPSIIAWNESTADSNVKYRVPLYEEVRWSCGVRSCCRLGADKLKDPRPPAASAYQAFGIPAYNATHH